MVEHLKESTKVGLFWDKTQLGGLTMSDGELAWTQAFKKL